MMPASAFLVCPADQNTWRGWPGWTDRDRGTPSCVVRPDANAMSNIAFASGCCVRHHSPLGSDNG